MIFTSVSVTAFTKQYFLELWRYVAQIISPKLWLEIFNDTMYNSGKAMVVVLAMPVTVRMVVINGDEIMISYDRNINATNDTKSIVITK